MKSLSVKLKTTLFILMSFILCSCMDLASNESKNKKALQKQFKFRQGQVYTMRGLGGIFSTGMNRLEDTLEDYYHIRTSSTIWYKGKGLSDYIIEHYKNKTLTGPIILIGHSLGGNEQIKVARNLYNANIPVALLITIDAVAPTKAPANVKEVLNIYKPSFVPMFSGIRIKAIDPSRTKIDNFNVAKSLQPIYLNHFTIDKHQVVQKIMLDKILAVLNIPNKTVA